MRDLALTAIVFGSIPFILRNPFIGLLMWVWVSIMNPHRLMYGFAFDMPFAQIVALCTLISVLVHTKKLNNFPTDRVTITLILFALWLGVSPLFSFHIDKESSFWLTAIKIQFMLVITLLIVVDRRQLHWFTWAVALCVGFFGIKGGLFTVLTAGTYRVWGPVGTYIADNNSLALAIIMVVPLFRYLQLHSDHRWIKKGCLAALVLCVIAAVGSQSRGAFLALATMSLFLFAKSRQKGLIGILVLLALPLAWFLMPESWSGRMSTIQTYDEDASALGRINAWWMAWNLAVDRFPIGGGFAVYEADVFQRYAPNPLDIHAAHSIYFQVLGEHGFMGLALFLLVFWFAWLNGSWVLRATRGHAGLDWARDLAAMCQVSLIAYATGGAFLSKTYFDLPYCIVVILIVLRRLVQEELKGTSHVRKVVMA